MRDFYCKIIRELEEEIGIRYIDNGDQISLCESMIEITLQKLTKLKRFINENEFKTIEDEIIFFKELKPKIVSKLIYYNAIYKIEMKKPHGGQRIIKKYLNNELAKLKRFFDNNLEFYKYYRTNSTYLDEKYFVRGKFDIKLSLDTFYFESDHSFSTSHDYKVAKVIANDLIEVYLEDQILNMNKFSRAKSKEIRSSLLKWTASKTSLIELIYSLHAFKAFDDGSSEIKVIVRIFENTFGIDLGDFYHTYLELRNRKNNRTKFLDLLKDSLIKKMDEQEGK